jgi:hypothetical protein
VSETARRGGGAIARDVASIAMMLSGVGTAILSVVMIAGVWGGVACAGAAVAVVGYLTAHYEPGPQRVRPPSETVPASTMEVRHRRPVDGPA